MNMRSTRRLSALRSPEDAPQLPPRKRPGYWITSPTPSVYCARASSIQKTPSDGDCSPPIEEPGKMSDHSLHRKRRCILQLEDQMEEEQVTRDLCTSFKNVESTEPQKAAFRPWSNKSKSNRMDIPESGTTSEEDGVRGGNDNKPSVDPVRSAAELLTLLTSGRSVDSNGQSPEVTTCTTNSRHAERRGLELPIRWGVRKKVSYESRRSNVDSCDSGLCSGLMRKFCCDHDKISGQPLEHPPDNKTENSLRNSRPGSAFHSTAIKLDGNSSPYYPSSSEFYGVHELSGETGTSSGLQLALVTNQGPRDQKRNKTPLSISRTVTNSGSILKLPREMQGRWSSERYKTAQLKLVDIMHERKAVPGKPILRPALREEARKHIGDTGLLDHLLKHMTDTVVSTGERFRRRHNCEGAMEYWLEHASLMDLRKAAGVEDPSWIPPLGWKPGDKLPDRNWHLYSKGLTSSEAAAMNHLKDTVDKLKSDMKLLYGSIKVSNQRGVLTSLSASHQITFGDTSTRSEVELDSTQEIRKDSMIQFKPELTNGEQQFRQEHMPGTNVGQGITFEPRLKKVQSEVLQIHEGRTPPNEVTLVSSNQVDLQGQLQDVRKIVSTMQADVNDIIKMLGIVPPIKATPVRYPLDPNMPRYPMPFLLSRRDGSSTVSLESQSPETQDTVLHTSATPKLMRQCSRLSNGIMDDQNSNGGDAVVNLVPYGNELSQALSNYKLVNEVDLLSARSAVEEKYQRTENSLPTGQEGVPQFMSTMKQISSPDFKPIFAGQPSGFKPCRSPGRFMWASPTNCSPMLPTNNPSMIRSQDQNVELRGHEDGSVNTSSRQTLELPNFNPTKASAKQTNFSTRSMAESQVAAVMASMFGCMATAPPHLSAPTLPLMTNEVSLNGKGTTSTTASHSGHRSSQSDPALSLSL